MTLLNFKYYVDFQPLPSAVAFIEQFVHQQPIYTANGGERFDIWQLLDDEVHQRSYDYTKYQKRSAVSFELLLPNCALTDVPTFAKLFLDELLQQSKLPCVCFVTKKGQGTYLQAMICERKYHDEQKEIIVRFENNRYRNKKTGQLCKADHPDAELSIPAGSAKSKYESRFSLKKRLFAIPKKEFKQFLEKIQRIIFVVCQKLNKIIKQSYFYKMIKHKVINRFYSRFVNMNIRSYNETIRYMNEVLSNLEEMIWSPACYYQDKELVKAFTDLFHKFRQRLSKKSFSYRTSNKKIRVALSVFNRVDRFKENIESFRDLFNEEIALFHEKYITY